jgi:hypothetical protein
VDRPARDQLSVAGPHRPRDQCGKHGRKNYQGFFALWPAVADDHNASPEDRTFSRWLNEVEKVVFSDMLTAVEWNNARLAVLHSDQLQPLPTQVRFACSMTGSDGHAQTDRL